VGPLPSQALPWPHVVAAIEEREGVLPEQPRGGGWGPSWRHLNYRRDILKMAENELEFVRIKRSSFRNVVRMIRKAMIRIGITLGVVILVLLVHWAVWLLIPPVPTHSLAKSGHFVSVHGIDTYYESQGAGAPLILIPPGGGHTSTWRNNLAVLSQSYQVWTLDLPGSGYSEKPPTFAYTHKAYAEFVKEFMETQGIQRAVVGGHSLGGTVALEFSLDYPDKTAGLILVAAGGYPRADKPGVLDPSRYELATAIMMSFSSYPFVVKGFLSNLYYDSRPFANDSKLISGICEINRTPHSRDAWYWMPRALNWDFALPDAGRIRSVAVPTLILWGNNDKIVSVKLAARFHQDIKNSLLTIVDQAGHMVHEEKPEPVNRAIIAFLSSLKW
jgi:4,5:9,10-diseco-3-hydroxy-5,9,17-trioxoandrosta-1(10),2-diene-4-oate hydrolase